MVLVFVGGEGRGGVGLLGLGVDVVAMHMIAALIIIIVRLIVSYRMVFSFG